MKSKSFLRNEIESSPRQELKKDPGWIKPGDQVLFEIDSYPGDLTKSLWGYVVDKKSKPDECHVSVDELFISNRRSRIHNGEVLKVKHSRIIGLIESFEFDNRPTIELVMQDGVITGIRRSDGKPAPIILIIEEDDQRTVYEVDHSGYVNI